MFIYDRKIIYLNLMISENKVGNAGFLKWEETENRIRWTMRVKGLRETDTGLFEIQDENGKTVDKILLNKGEGTYVNEFDKGGETGTGEKSVEKISEIRIKLPGRRWLEGKRNICNGREKSDPDDRAVMKNVEKTAVKMPDKVQEENMRVLQAADISEKENTLAQEKRMPVHQPELFEDKWEQLRHIYPSVHPFKDEREFLSVTPRDFVILEKNYHKMVRNSFLLHGYYNYRHVILGKYQDRGEDVYYLGVPGVYYDREKMAAEMFGFEAFEGKVTPAEPGSFGYYMKRVRI